MPAKKKWKWAFMKIVSRLRKKGGFDVSKILAAAQATNSTAYIEVLFNEHSYSGARQLSEETVRDVERGRIADSHIIQDLARLLLTWAHKIGRRGRILFAEELVSKAERIFVWFADRLERMMKTLRSAFSFTGKSETPTFVISLQGLIESAKGYMLTLRGKHHLAIIKYRRALLLEYQLYKRNANDLKNMEVKKKVNQELGSGTCPSLALSHLHHAACLTALKKHTEACREAKQAVKYMQQCLSDHDIMEAKRYGNDADKTLATNTEFLQATVLYNYGVRLINTGKYADGVGELYLAYRISQEIYGERDRRTAKFKKYYIQARSKNHPGLGQYPVLRMQVEVPKLDIQPNVRAKSVFPSNAMFKIYSRNIEAAFLLPYSYTLNQSKIHVPIQKHVNPYEDKPIPSPSKKRMRRSKTGTFGRRSSSPSSPRRPETAGAVFNRGRSRSGSWGRTMSSTSSPRTPRRPSTGKKRRPSTAGTIYSGRRMYVKNRNPYLSPGPVPRTPVPIPVSRPRTSPSKMRRHKSPTRRKSARRPHTARRYK